MKTISVICCLLYAAGIEGAGIKVEGFEGEEISFQCSHRYAWQTHKYLCKDPCKDGKDTLVRVQNGGRVKSGRITLVDSGDGVFNVTFSHLQLSDMGRYWCAVERYGFDSFKEVQVTVKEAVANETTTAISELSPTWTYLNIWNSAKLTPAMNTTMPANLSTAPNNTNGGKQNSSTGIVLYATVGTVAMLTILLLAIIVGKRRVKLKPQPQVCSNSTNLVRADEGEDDCEYDDIGEDVQSMLFSCSHYPKQNPPTECSVPSPIYENICCGKGTEHPRHSAANFYDKHAISSGIYINPLPPFSERTGEGRLGKHTNKLTATKNVTSKPTESCTGNASACHCRSHSDSTGVRPRSLWFGLDVSGTV